MVEIDADELPRRDAVRRLAALLPDAATARAAADALKLSNANRARLEQAMEGDAITAPLAARSARILLYRLGPACFRDKVWLAWADAPRRGNAIQWRMLLDMADNYRRPHFPLTGLDVMQAGVPEGPEVGRVLGKLEDWWVEGDFAADEGALREKLASLLNGA
jgi:poly(A) polymerase